jgi:D-sedoheptulose 7-phosphate isomerase
MKQYIGAYLDKIKDLLESLDAQSIEKATQLIEAAYNNENNIFIIGNGGSASTASHMANDFSKGIHTGTDKHVKALSLTDNTSLLTAISNDNGYEKVFVDQLKVFLKKNDVVIGFSASGDSTNVLNAMQYAKDHSAKTIGLVGFDGGKMKDIVDVCIHVKTPKGWYGPVEDIHMIVDHIISGYFNEKFKKE